MSPSPTPRPAVHPPELVREERATLRAVVVRPGDPWPPAAPPDSWPTEAEARRAMAAELRAARAAGVRPVCRRRAPWPLPARVYIVRDGAALELRAPQNPGFHQPKPYSRTS